MISVVVVVVVCVVMVRDSSLLTDPEEWYGMLSAGRISPLVMRCRMLFSGPIFSSEICQIEIIKHYQNLYMKFIYGIESFLDTSYPEFGSIHNDMN